MKIPLLSGIYADSVADFIESYPINREPVVMSTGLSEGYLRVAPGITGIGTGPGADRGAINWNGVCYRVMGTKLLSVAENGATTILGDVGSGGQCTLDYSFVNLIIATGERLYYWNPTAGFRQVTDPDLGLAVDAIWIDGYTMTTDGESLVVTELNDPMAVDPLKYGSSEEDPDPVIGLFRIRGEVYALNANTIEVFDNIGGSGFPFARNAGAQIPYGCVGTHAKSLFVQTFAFVGSARNEALGVYLAGAGDASKLSTRQIDKLLAELTDEQQAAITMESRVDEDEQRLLVHLPDKTLVFFATASRRSEQKIWAIYSSGVNADQPYRGRNGALAYGRWIVGDADGNIGMIDSTVPTHYGAVTGWQFDTALLFNETGRGIVNSMTLTGLPGRALPGADPRLFLSYTIDGVTWGQEYAIASGTLGQRTKILQWRKPRRFDSWIGARFRGADNGMAPYARLDAVVEALAA
jgi:hypothetical protein